VNEPDAKKPTDRINNLEKELYERNFKTTLPPLEQRFSERKAASVEKLWQHDTASNEPLPKQTTKVVAGSFFRKILLIAVLFFMASAGLLVYMFYGGWNVISATNVDISFLGPVSVAAGSELDFDVVISNQNRSAIDNVTLYIDYPDGTKSAQDITSDFLHDKQMLGEVLSKSSMKFTARSVLFGELNSQKNIKVVVSYGLKNSNATFRKEKEYDVNISSTPLNVSVSYPQQAVSGDQVDFVATVTSNSSAPLTNVLLKVDYPFGFSFANANPQPTYDSNFWLIPTLKPGEKKDFTIHGTLQGEQGDERVFRYTIGAQDLNNKKVVGVRYLSQPESVFIQKTPLAVSVTLNNSAAPIFVTNQGDNILGTVNVVNNLPTRVTNAVVQVSFSGALFDPSNVHGGQGFFQSINNTILWDKNSIAQLASLEPGQSASLPFNFATLPAGTSALKGGQMTLKATVTGEDSTQANVSHSISYSQIKTIETHSSIALTPQIVYSMGPFKNKGPIPPKVNVPTTYTVILSASDSTNDVQSGEVHATLPSYVHWLGATNPSNESVTWNPDKNEVIWHVGDITAGTGYGKPARQVAFQIQFLPSISQVGSIVSLVTNLSMTAKDAFTNADLSSTPEALTTRLQTDTKFNGEEQFVAK
jgi:hypothetical protein